MSSVYICEWLWASDARPPARCGWLEEVQEEPSGHPPPPGTPAVSLGHRAPRPGSRQCGVTDRFVYKQNSCFEE